MHRSFWALVAVAIILAGCNGGSSATPTATSIPTAAPTEPPAEASAHLVYLKDGNVWIADAGGQNATQLSSGGPAGFAGVGLTPEGDAALHYTVMDEATQQFTMYRALPGSIAQEVFSFQGNDKNAEFSSGNASVSPAGDIIAFVDEDGLALYFTNIGNTRRLLNNVPCDTGTDCHGYFFPTWSPDGGELSALKIFFEGSRLVIVGQGSDPATERELEYGTYLDTAAWSIGGTRLCLPENNYAGGPALVVDVASGEATPVFAEPAKQATTRLIDCNWSSDGRLAMAYNWAINEHAAAPDRLAVFGPDGTILFDDSRREPADAGHATVRWLDNESIVIDYANAPAQVVQLDGTVQPLSVDIGDLVAVVEY